jgi:beta-propeller repeat-containing protein
VLRSLFFALTLNATLLVGAPQAQTFRRSLVFEPNLGQAPAEVKWIGRGPGYRLFFTSGGITAVVIESTSSKQTYSSVRMNLTGGQPWKNVTGLDPTGGLSNYFRGKNGRNAITKIPHYSRVKVPRVYDGIDLVFYSNGGSLEYDFVVSPGADARKIQLAFEGQQHLAVDAKSGDLVLTTPYRSEMRQLRPKVYQQIGNRRVELGGGYKLLEGGRAQFTFAGYDSRHPLVIDPAVVFTVFLQGQFDDQAQAVSIDAEGNSYVTGSTESFDFPLHQALYLGTDECDTGTLGGFCDPGSQVFVTKLSPSGMILFSTYLGVSTGNHGTGIAVDATGVYITGYAYGYDFPDKLPGGGSDVRLGGADLFVTKLSPDGQQLIYSRILGGRGNQFANGIAVDSRHAVWVTGNTDSRTFLVGAPFQYYYAAVNGPSDLFYTKLGPSGEWVFTGLAGGSGTDAGLGVAIDLDDNPWFTGQTCSPDFPASVGFNNIKGQCGIFAFALNNQSQIGTWRFGAVFGGAEDDAGTAIVVDSTRQAYITGRTRCPLFPIKTGGFQTVFPSTGTQAFVTTLDGFGHFVYSTLFGGDGDTFGRSIAVNTAGEVYVAGDTSSMNFPGVPPFTPNPTAGFVSKLSKDLSTLLFTTLLGAEADGVAVLDNSTLFFTPPQVYTAGFRFTGGVGFGTRDAFVVKLNDFGGILQFGGN